MLGSHYPNGQDSVRFTAKRKSATSRNTIQDGEGGLGKKTSRTQQGSFFFGMGVWVGIIWVVCVGVHHGWLHGEYSYQSYPTFSWGPQYWGYLVPRIYWVYSVYIPHCTTIGKTGETRSSTHTCAFCMTMLFRWCGCRSIQSVLVDAKDLSIVLNSSVGCTDFQPVTAQDPWMAWPPWGMAIWPMCKICRM